MTKKQFDSLSLSKQMKVVCANCRMRYGRHQLVGDSCPKRGKADRDFQASMFKLPKEQSK